MRLLSSDAPVPADLARAVIALGNFDGFHRGHQAVVARAVSLAKARGVPAIVATFDPHPARFFRPDAPPFRLTTIAQRARLFAEAGAEATLVLAFDAALAGLDPAAFVALLAQRCGASALVTGEDFTFGRAKAGTVTVLAALAAERGLAIETVAAVTDAAGPISSSRIREALVTGDCETATGLLTRPYAIEGIVIHGDKVGRTIGYPTANLEFGDYLRPRYGIYAVRGRLDDGRMLDGAANLGIRPSFDPPRELLEPTFFDFDGDLYGQEIAVQLVSFIRPEAKFDSLVALAAQMSRDCEEARGRLGAAA